MEAGPGTLIPNPKGLSHGMRNLGEGHLTVLAVKHPRPDGES